MVQELLTRLKALSPIISEIIKISSSPGATIGVLHQGDIIHTEGFGFRDVAKQLPSDENTIYYLSSLSKSFTSSMIAVLVEQGKLEWTTPVSQILPNFHHWDEKVQKEANILDFLTHQTGLAPKNNVWNQEFARASLEHRDTIPMVNNLEKLFDLRTGFQYSNWGFAVADEVVLALSKDLSFGTALKHHIFEPLGLTRTILTRDSKLENRAEPYQALTNGTVFHLPIRPCLEDGSIMQGAVGIQSSVHDVLTYYKALLAALKDQTDHETTTTKNNPLAQVPMQLRGYQTMFEIPSGGENSYAMGWARTELPAPLGSIGLNPTYVEMPIVAKGIAKPVLTIWHQGSNNCTLNFVALFPETQSAILVLTNGLANNDVADWIGQLLLETYLDSPEKNDYIELATRSAANSNARWPKIKADLERERTRNTHPKALLSYVGRFYNRPKTLYLEIDLKDNALQMCFQGNHDQWYPLEHYEDDVFTWVLTRDESVHRGRFPVTWRAFYKLRFQASESNKFESLIWENDGAWEAGETFRRDDNLVNGKM